MSVSKKPSAVLPLTIEEINQYKQLPVLTKSQIARVLQVGESTVLQLSRRRAKHRLPVFRVGRGIGSTYALVEKWLQERQAEVAPPQKQLRKAA